jgi:hypothetical protein
MSSHDPTPSLAEFAEAEKADSNAWWRISCGDHLNLFEMAKARIEDLEEAARVHGTKRSSLVHVHRDQVESWSRIGKEHTEYEAAIVRVEALCAELEDAGDSGTAAAFRRALRGEP